MYNPFGLLSAKLLQALIQSGNTWFVRQTWKRGMDPQDTTQKGAFLFTHYNNAGRAHIHYDALAHDPNRFLYDSTLPDHYKKLETAAAQPLGFRVYSPLLEKEWKPSGLLSDKLRRYITGKLQWTPGRNDTVKAELFTQFGELFITLKNRGNRIKVPLSDIENY